MRSPLLLTLLLSACFWVDNDFDNDGVPSSEDCDDRTDEIGAPPTWFDDRDGDGFGTGTGVEACEQPLGGVLEAGDCDDDANGVNPGASEICDGIDNDCNGTVDEGCPTDTDPPEHTDPPTGSTGDTGDTLVVVPPTGDTGDTDGDTDDTGLSTTGDTGDTAVIVPPVLVQCFRDHDGDAYGLSGTELDFENSCPLGWAELGGDCNDTQQAVHPGAVDDPGDSTDEDCDGRFNCFVDGDADGFGGTQQTAAPLGLTCTQAPGASSVDTDCDDLAGTVFPGAAEICDGLDNDCDMLVPPFEVDLDGDGFLRCSGDCDDVDPNVNVSVPEDCSDATIDYDCDGDPTTASYYEDLDQDGYGGTKVTSACDAQPPNALHIGGDCDDADADVHPNAFEIVGDEVDQDCDDVLLCFLDADGDSFGVLQVVSNVTSCREPGFAETPTDCDDSDSLVNPAAPEIVDPFGVDEDCSGTVACFTDPDSDGVGGLPVIDLDECQVFTDGDCDSTRDDVFPGAPELCDGADNDCNGVIPSFEIDTDGDHFVQCPWVGAAPYADGDCAPTDPLAYPGADEIPGDGIDQDCDGVDHCYPDLDLDNHGAGLAVPGPALDCGTTDGWSELDDDCDDLAAEQNPSATEICNGIDDDCDPLTQAGDETDVDQDGFPLCANDCDDDNPAVNPGAPEDCTTPEDENCDGILGVTDYWPDNDQDGFGDAGSVPESTCTPSAGWVTNDDDCDDTDSGINPAADEVRDNAVDENCDGLQRCRVDADGDGFGTNQNELVGSCAVFQGGDCLDGDPASHPGAIEACDGVDNDCVGGVPANELDADADSVSTCAGDCDDADPARYPGATEICDGIDNDCVDGIPANELDADGDLQRICAGDCNDGDPTVFNGAPEICDGLRNNCANGTNPPVTEVDNDGDHFVECGTPTSALPGGDCDDMDVTAYPMAEEIPGSGVDEDCDGLEICFVDLDGDGFGQAEILTADLACAGAGKSSEGEDCDDAEPAAYPGGIEICDGIDNDCHAGPDYTHPIWGGDEVVNADGDPALSCNDCNDADAGVYPGAMEICGDTIDQNCDGLTDGGTYYDDLDGDGYGDPSTEQVSCTAISGAVTNGSDCDDSDANVRPGAIETANNDVDENCDGQRACYVDNDGDSFGAGSPVNVTGPTCAIPTRAIVNGDCSDSNAARFPGNPEICDGIDNDCNNVFLPAEIDSDGDGYVTCTGVGPKLGLGDDCAPSNPAINPGAMDVPLDGIDSDCDGSEFCYQDGDLDTFGAGPLTANPGISCTAAGWSVNDDDCDDDNAAVKPTAPEVPADGIDQNCDLQEACYVDADGDAFGSMTTVSSASLSCTAAGVADNPADCDDGNGLVNPDADEVVNSIDDDCDGLMACYVDGDDDDYGTSSILSTASCAATNWATQNGDCNDGDPAINPAASELPDNDVDENCDAMLACYNDGDGDGFGSGSTTVGVLGGVLTCATPTTSVLGGDCNDMVAVTYPDAPEICDGIVNDCGSPLDPDELDLDADGYVTCTGGGIAGGDCDDGDSDSYPGAPEVVGNLVDEDCDGVLTCYADADGDGYGALLLTNPGTCSVPGVVASVAGDCNDADDTIYTGAPEICDGLDNDCDTAVPANESDIDGDDYAACVGVGPLLGLGGDCDDTNGDVFPGQLEVCDGFDNDCDTAIDDVDQLYDGNDVFLDLSSALVAGAFDLNLCGKVYGAPIGTDNVTITGLGADPFLFVPDDANALILTGPGSLDLLAADVRGDATASVTTCIGAQAGATVTFTDVALSACNDTSAPFKLEQSTLIVDDFHMFQNSGSSTGGIACNDCTINGDRLMFTANASSTNAGGLSIAGPAASVTLDRIGLYENSALDEGGGLFVDDNAVVRVQNLELVGNQASRGAALSMVNNAYLRADDQTIDGNRSAGLPAGNVEVTSATLELFGGPIRNNLGGYAVYVRGGSLNLESVDVLGNDEGVLLRSGARMTAVRSTFQTPNASPALIIEDASGSATSCAVQGASEMVQLTTPSASWCFLSSSHDSAPPNAADLRFHTGGTIDLGGIPDRSCAAGTCGPVSSCP